METKGQHLIVDAYGCRAELINNADEVKRLMLESLRELNMDILLAYFHAFSLQGVTGIIAISSSHFSIHTWPEHGYAAMDLYTCSYEDTWPVLKKFLGKIGAERVYLCEITRGIEEPIISKQRENLQTIIETPVPSPFKRRGNDWDAKILKEIKIGQHNVLHKNFSGFHDIYLVEAKDLRLYINEELQFSSLDERHYHEPLVLPAMELAKSRERVLILGGGDGLSLREVLKYPDVLHVDLVDIDPQILDLAKNEPALAAQNAGSLKDVRIKVRVEDAKEYLKRMNGNRGYDVIIIDFPDPVDADTSLLYTKELFQDAGRHLKAEGILACQANSPEDTLRVFWSIAKTLNAAGFRTKAYYTVVPSFGVWGFHLATRDKITSIPAKISVPHQAIQPNLESLFQLPRNFLPPESGIIINQRNNLRLHDLYQEEIEKVIPKP